MRFLSLLLLGLYACVVCVFLGLSEIVLVPCVVSVVVALTDAFLFVGDVGVLSARVVLVVQVLCLVQTTC